MTLELSSFDKVTLQLEEGIQRYQKDITDIQIRDGLVQRFEFTYELSHKMLQRGKTTLKSLITPVLFSSALLASGHALANSTTPPQRLVDKTYATLGLQGIGIGLGKSHSSTLGYRVDLNGGKLNTDGVESGTRYQGELELQSAGVYMDYFPWAGSFRLSAGLAYFGSKLSLSASGTGQTLRHTLAWALDTANAPKAVCTLAPIWVLIWAISKAA